MAVRHPMFAVTICAALAYLACAFFAPKVVLWLTTEEGPSEHPQPFILAAVIGVWITAARRLARGGDNSSRPAVVVAVSMAVYLAFVLMEEINWGEVYGVDLGYSLVRRWTGQFAFHSIPSAGAPWKDPTHYIILPMLLYFALPLIPATRRWRDRLGPVGARFDEAVVFFLSAALELTVFLISPISEFNKSSAPYGDSRALFQTLVYVLLFLMGLRACREADREVTPG